MKKGYLYINGVSDVGSRMNLLAFTAFLMQFENSALWIMAFFLLRQVGALLASLFAGYVADFLPRRMVMIGSDVFAGLSLLTVVFYPTPLVACISITMMGIFYTFFSVSFYAAIPDIVGENQTEEANRLVVRLTALASIIGFAVGGLLTDWFGYKVVLLLDIATFWVSALVLWRMNWDISLSKSVGQGMLSGIKEGFSYLKRNTFLLWPTVLVGTMAIGVSGYNYALPIFSQSMEAFESTLHGLLWSVLSIGAFIGSFLVKRVHFEASKLYYSAISAFILLVSVVFIKDSYVVVCFILLLIGVTHSFEQASLLSINQRSDIALRGRVFGLQALTSRTGFLIGFLIAPFILKESSLLFLVMIMQAGTVGVLGYIGIKKLLMK